MLLTAEDFYLFNEGSHCRLYQKMGAHIRARGGRTETSFAVWAPNARSVSVVGDFNEWTPAAHPLEGAGESGIWQGAVADLAPGAIYKYHIVSRYHEYRVNKADPFAFYSEVPPRTGSIVWDMGYAWQDGPWMASRKERTALTAPISIYEVHLGSWRRVLKEGNRLLSYREIAEPLADYVAEMGFTHVEFLPLMEHPFYGSWGYQTTGFFAATSRYGTPQELMSLIDALHGRGVGVILDWVPSHFPTDEHGLGYFDGTHLFEHADPRQGFHPDWNSAIFNYGRKEVQSFLTSSALFWLDVFHVDALRVDGVASMLHLDYSRPPGQWVPNKYGGRENLEAIDFLRRLNETVYAAYPDVQTIAEESTAWPMVSRPTSVGGLGFGYKWDMGWMHDTLSYFAHDPIHRKFHHAELTFRMIYAFSENFVLSLSHDEVVYGKRSLLGKMPGDSWQKFANLRLLLGYWLAQPGKKLLFMGGEVGVWEEWSHESSLDWALLTYPEHRGIQKWVEDLNALYRRAPALYEKDCEADGFAWVDCCDSDNSCLAFLRYGHDRERPILVVFNFTPVVRTQYRVGIDRAGVWRERLNSDSHIYGGSNVGNFGCITAEPLSAHGRPHSLVLTLPPLGVLFLAPEENED